MLRVSALPLREALSLHFDAPREAAVRVVIPQIVGGDGRQWLMILALACSVDFCVCELDRLDWMDD